MIVQMPQTLKLGLLEIELVRYDITESSDSTGSEKDRIFGPPRWKIDMASTDDLSFDEADEWLAMVLALDGRLNHLAVFDAGRPVPRGTMRGTLTLAAPVTEGDDSMTLAGAEGTLKVGDGLQIGAGVGSSQFVKVMAPVEASGGTATVTFKSYANFNFAAGTPVIWDHPVVYCKQLGKSAKWRYMPGTMLQGAYGLSLLESFG